MALGKFNAGTGSGGSISVRDLPTIPVSKGGTGATDAEAALANLGAAAAGHTHSLSSLGAAAASHTHSATAITATRNGDTVNNWINYIVDTLIPNAANSGAKIATGSYVGTGTYGAANPCSLTFGFVPKFVIISPETDGWTLVIADWDTSSYKMVVSPTNATYVRLSSVSTCVIQTYGATIRWYYSGSGNADACARSQANLNGAIHRYFAIG